VTERSDLVALLEGLTDETFVLNRRFAGRRCDRAVVLDVDQLVGERRSGWCSRAP